MGTPLDGADGLVDRGVCRTCGKLRNRMGSAFKDDICWGHSQRYGCHLENCKAGCAFPKDCEVTHG